MSAPALTGAGLLAAVALLHVRDPHAPGSYAYCPVNFLTGLHCPGCGGLRALNDLSHGHVADALSSNLLVAGLVLPLAIVLWLGWARSRWDGRAYAPRLLAGPVVWSALVLVLVFGLVRNLPFGSWLAP
jgi:hypothetical protein